MNSTFILTLPCLQHNVEEWQVSGTEYVSWVNADVKSTETEAHIWEKCGLSD